MDSSEEMLEIARRENSFYGCKRMDITILSFENESFNGIWTIGVLLHLALERLALALQEFHGTIRAKGVLFIPTRTDKNDRHTVEPSSEGGEIEVFYYSQETMFSKLEMARFETIWVYTDTDDSGRDFNYIHLLCRRIQAHLTSTLLSQFPLRLS